MYNILKYYQQNVKSGSVFGEWRGSIGIGGPKFDQSMQQQR